MSVVLFFKKKKQKQKQKTKIYRHTYTRAHTHTRTHKQAHTHVPFDIHVQVWVLCDGMEHSSLPAESCLVGFISCPRPHPAGSWRTHTHTHKCSDDTLNLLSFIVKMQLELSGHFAYYKCRGHIIL